MSNPKTRVKKISPYPISAQLDANAEVRKGSIVKLTPSGFLIEVDSVVVSVGREYKVQFTIPSTDRRIVEKVKVVKIYDRHQPLRLAGEKPELRRLAEMHFLAISLVERKWIREFMIEISQNPEKL